MYRWNDKTGVLMRPEMIPGREGQFGTGNRQTQVALVLVVQASSRLLDVVPALVINQVEVMPQNIAPGHTPAPNHKSDRQHEGLQSDERASGRQCDM